MPMEACVCAGFTKSGGDRPRLISVPLNEALVHEEDFFRMILCELLAGGDDPANPSLDSDGVPRFTDAVTVDKAGGEIGGHLRGRQNDEADILIGVDAAAHQPPPDHEIV